MPAPDSGFTSVCGSHTEQQLWLLFPEDQFGRAVDVSRLIEPWAAKNGILTALARGNFAIALDIQVGEEKAGVIRALADNLKEIAMVLNSLPPKTVGNTGQEFNDEISD